MTAAVPHIDCADRWPPGSCSTEALLAYETLVAVGQISITRVYYGRITGKIVIRYLAAAPHEWVLESLKAIKSQIVGSKKEYRQVGMGAGSGAA